MANYTFELNDIACFPLINDEFSITFEKDSDNFFYTQKLDSDIKLIGVDFDTVVNATMDFRFKFEIYKDADVIFTGYFFKKDCEIDLDYRRLTVKPKANNGVEEIKKIQSIEYDILKIQCPRESVSFRALPILQFVLVAPGYQVNKVTSICGMSYWEEDMSGPITSENDLISLGFVIIMEIIGERTIWGRWLSPYPSTFGYTFYPRIAEPITTAPYYRWTYGAANAAIYVDYWSSTTEIPTEWGLAPNGDYYEDYAGDIQGLAIPIFRSYWGTAVASVWFVLSGGFSETIHNEGLITHVKDFFALGKVIDRILAQDTSIKHLEQPLCSQFLYSGADPIGFRDWNLYITQKSNIVNLNYSEPAAKAPIKLIDILSMLSACFNVFWYITENGETKLLKFEHISFFENGGSYDEPNIGIDLQTSTDVRTQKPLGYYQNKYKYEVDGLWYTTDVAWGVDTSKAFAADKIKALDAFIDIAENKTKSAGVFMSDINNVIGSQTASLDGFVICNVTRSNNTVPSVIVDTDYNVYSQNGQLAMRTLLYDYYRHAAPCPNIEINGTALVAESTLKTKTQQVSFCSNVDINPQQLVKTDIGIGKIKSIKKFIFTNKYEIQLLHDTQ